MSFLCKGFYLFFLLFLVTIFFMENIRVCRLCGSEARLFRVIEKWSPSLVIFRCQKCGFQFQDIKTNETLHFYDEGYYTGQGLYTYQDERQNKKASMAVWQARVKCIAQKDKSQGPKRWLDVGCAFGGLLEVAQSFGYGVYGLEVSEYAARYASQIFPGRIWVGNIENYVLPQDFFSVVSLIEVIEHLGDPLKALKNSYGTLQKGGVLLIQTADMDGLQARIKGADYHYYLPGHLSYFDRHNLAFALRKVGFSRVKFVGGVEFGLLPKLIKSRETFRSLWDYRHWVRITLYHFASKITLGPWHLTSSMVMIAWK